MLEGETGTGYRRRWLWLTSLSYYRCFYRTRLMFWVSEEGTTTIQCRGGPSRRCSTSTILLAETNGKAAAAAAESWLLSKWEWRLMICSALICINLCQFGNSVLCTATVWSAHLVLAMFLPVYHWNVRYLWVPALVSAILCNYKCKNPLEVDGGKTLRTVALRQWFQKKISSSLQAPFVDEMTQGILKNSKWSKCLHFKNVL